MAAKKGHLAVVEVSVFVLGVGCGGMSRAFGVLTRENIISTITCEEISCVIFIRNTLRDNGVFLCTLQQLICIRYSGCDRTD